MATEGDKLQSLISKMVEIETAEQPAEEVVVEMTPEERGRLELQRAVSHAYKIMDGVERDSFQTDAEEILFEQIVKDLAELEMRVHGKEPHPVGTPENNNAT